MGNYKRINKIKRLHKIATKTVNPELLRQLSPELQEAGMLDFSAQIPGGELSEREGFWDFGTEFEEDEEPEESSEEPTPTIAPPMLLEDYLTPLSITSPTTKTPTQPPSASSTPRSPVDAGNQIFGRNPIWDDSPPPEFPTDIPPEDAPSGAVWKRRRQFGLPRKNIPPPKPYRSRVKKPEKKPETKPETFDPLDPAKPLNIRRSKSRQKRLTKLAKLLR